MSSTPSPVLVGREAEIRTLGAALDRAAGGDGGTFFLTGDPGIGKSRLAAEVSDLASRRGFAVYCGSARSAESVPFGPIAQALAGLGQNENLAVAAEVSEYRSVLAALIPGMRAHGQRDHRINPLMVAEALLRVLDLAGPAGALLIIDDVHCADPETLATIEYLADNLAARRVLCLASLRDDEPSAGGDLVRSIQVRRSADLIRLPRLGTAEVEDMARACLGGELISGPAATRLLASCDGLPFAVEEMLAAAAASGELRRQADGWEVNDAISTGMPDSIVGSTRNRLAVLGADVADIIVAAAVLGRRFDWTLLPAVSGTGEREVIAALAQARGVQLIEPDQQSGRWLRFRHNLTREAIVADLAPPDRASRSATAAAAVQAAHPGLPAAWCDLTARLYEAAGQHATAARLLLESGRRALVLGAVGTAADSLTEARGQARRMEAPAPALTAEIDESLVKALALTGDFSRLAPLVGEAVAGLEAGRADPGRRARILLMAARTESDTSPGVAASHLAAARAIADHLHSPITSSWADAIAARCALNAGDLGRAEELARLSLAGAEAAELSGCAAEVAFESLDVIGRRERLRDVDAARAAFERAARLAHGSEFAVRRVSALHELGALDVLQRGDMRRLAEASELAHDAGAIATATAIDLELANIWCLDADLDRAFAASRRCQQGARLIKSPRLEALALAAQSMIWGIKANRRAAKAAAGRAERALPGNSEVLAATRGGSRVAASLFIDDIAQAVRESNASIDYVQQSPPHSPSQAWAFYVLLQTVSGGDGRDAVERAHAAGAATGWNLAWFAYAEAVLAGRAGHPRRATALARQAADLFRPYAPWWNHLARRLTATDAIKDEWGHPASWMREATREFDAGGYRRLASSCRRVLRGSGERVPRTGRGQARVPAQLRQMGVTSREMDVFLLIASGLSNADIAASLFISPKTVETHIASLVTKTGQAGRRDLAANAARLAPS